MSFSNLFKSIYNFLSNKNIGYNCLKNDFKFFYSLDGFQIHSHVPKICYEGCYINRNFKFNTKLNYHLKYEVLSNPL
jgi:hypothetical protein